MSVLYLLILSALMFVDLQTAREYLAGIDSNLKTGPVVVEKNYAEDCRFYTPDLDHPFYNFWDRVDIFMTAHFLGWLVKALVIREWRLLWISSLLFEWMEVSLKHLLPNFYECWWDHWILDVFGCNLAGIVIGLWLCNRFNMKHFDWRTAPPSWGSFLSSRVKFSSFEIYSWPPFLSDVRTYGLLLGYIATVQLVDLNVFFLKYLLVLPTSHPIVVARTIFLGVVAASGTRDYYEYLTNPNQARIGQQAWLNTAMLCSEIVLIIRFGREVFIDPPPCEPFIINLWWGALVVVILGFFVAYRNGGWSPRHSRSLARKASFNRTDSENAGVQAEMELIVTESETGQKVKLVKAE